MSLINTLTRMVGLLDSYFGIKKSGASPILQPGIGGSVIVRQPGGVAGTDELQLSHDGTSVQYVNADPSGKHAFNRILTTADGSVSLPALAGTDADTGVYFGAAANGQVKFAVGGFDICEINARNTGSLGSFLLNAGTPILWGAVGAEDTGLARLAAGVAYPIGDNLGASTAWFQQPAGFKKVSANFTKTADTTLADISGLSVTLKVRNYAFRAVLRVTADVAGGYKVSINGTATATTMYFDTYAIDTTGISLPLVRNTTLGSSAGVSVTAATVKVVIEGFIAVSGAGTLTVQFAQNAAVGASTVNRLSIFEVQDVA